MTIDVQMTDDDNLDVNIWFPGGVRHSHLTLANDTELVEALSVLPYKWEQSSRSAQILAIEARLQRIKDLYFT